MSVYEDRGTPPNPDHLPPLGKYSYQCPKCGEPLYFMYSGKADESGRGEWKQKYAHIGGEKCDYESIIARGKVMTSFERMLESAGNLV